MAKQTAVEKAPEPPVEREPHNALYEALRKVLLAGISVVAIAQEEIDDLVEKLVERGEIAEKDGKKFVVVGGREGPEYDAIPAGRPSFLADGTVAYLAVKDRVLYSVQHLP